MCPALYYYCYVLIYIFFVLRLNDDVSCGASFFQPQPDIHWESVKTVLLLQLVDVRKTNVYLTVD